MSNSLPNKENCHIELTKIENYLLNNNHAEGKSKAKYFNSFGFDKQNTSDFLTALKEHAINQQLISTTNTDYGDKYILKCEISTPDKRNPCIFTVWIIETESTQPRLVTAYPCYCLSWRRLTSWWNK